MPGRDGQGTGPAPSSYEESDALVNTVQ